jgi:hypothetical protein
MRLSEPRITLGMDMRASNESVQKTAKTQRKLLYYEPKCQVKKKMVK